MSGGGSRRAAATRDWNAASCAAVGQFAVQEQVRDLVEGAVLGQVADGVAAVAEPALDGADRGLAGDDAFEAGGVGGSGHC